jgi:hypothetical protein
MTDTNVTADTTVDTNAVVDTTVATVVATPAAVEPKAPKAPSKKSLADAIFAVKLIERSEGLFASNKEFRAAVLTQIQTDLGVTIASAATMYNAAKKAAETEDATVALGRDPKKEKAPAGTGKRGRPVGSKNKPKEEGAELAAEAVPGTVVEPGVVLTAVDAEPAAVAGTDAAADAATAEAVA